MTHVYSKQQRGDRVQKGKLCNSHYGLPSTPMRHSTEDNMHDLFPCAPQDRKCQEWAAQNTECTQENVTGYVAECGAVQDRGLCLRHDI